MSTLPKPDVAQVLSRCENVIVARTFSHETLEELAQNSSIPVINALSDLEHPCQALADLLTIYEKKNMLEGITLAYVGDANNVANSLVLAASLAGMNFRIASPPGYQIKEGILRTAREYATETGSEIFCTEDPREAVRGADVVYTDAWTSMGQEAEAEQRRRIFANYQVNGELLSLARGYAILMHCLPAHHGEEVAEIYSTVRNRLSSTRQKTEYTRKKRYWQRCWGGWNCRWRITLNGNLALTARS